MTDFSVYVNYLFPVCFLFLFYPCMTAMTILVSKAFLFDMFLCNFLDVFHIKKKLIKYIHYSLLGIYYHTIISLTDK